jgi:hypothetical protein
VINVSDFTEYNYASYYMRCLVSSEFPLYTSDKVRFFRVQESWLTAMRHATCVIGAISLLAGCNQETEPAAVDDLSDCSIAVELCPTATLCEDSSCKEAPYQVEYTEAQSCVFAALAGRETGLLRVESACDDQGCLEDVILISGADTASRQTQMVGGGCGRADRVRVVSAVFLRCLRRRRGLSVSD